MSDFTGQTRYVKYTHVNVSDEHNKYRMSIAGYSGNVGKSFAMVSEKCERWKKTIVKLFFSLFVCFLLFVFCFVNKPEILNGNNILNLYFFFYIIYISSRIKPSFLLIVTVHLWVT